MNSSKKSIMCQSVLEITDEIIDVDKESTQVEKINEWNDRMQKILVQGNPDETVEIVRLENYSKSLKVLLNTSKTTNDWKAISETIQLHLLHLQSSSKDKDKLKCRRIDHQTQNYRLYEEILSAYATIELNIVAETFRTKDSREEGNAKKLQGISDKIIKTLSVSFTYNWREVNIVHCLLKVKYDRRSSACVSIMKTIYNSVLFLRTIVDTDDVTLCGSYLLFCKYKKFIPSNDHNRMMQTFLGRYNKKHDFLNNFQMLREILCLGPGPLAEQTSTRKVHIVNNYFKYIKERSLLLKANQTSVQANATCSFAHEDDVHITTADHSKIDEDGDVMIINDEKESDKSSKSFALTQNDPQMDFKRTRTKSDKIVRNSDVINELQSDLKLKSKNRNGISDNDKSDCATTDFAKPRTRTNNESTQRQMNSEERIVKLVESTSIDDNNDEHERDTDEKTIFLVDSTEEPLDSTMESNNISSSTQICGSQSKVNNAEPLLGILDDRLVDSTSISSTVASISSIDEEMQELSEESLTESVELVDLTDNDNNSANLIDSQAFVIEQCNFDEKSNLPVYSTNITSSVISIPSVDEDEEEIADVTSTAEDYHYAEDEQDSESVDAAITETERGAEVCQAADSTNIPRTVQITAQVNGKTMYVLRMDAPNMMTSLPSVDDNTSEVQAFQDDYIDVDDAFCSNSEEYASFSRETAIETQIKDKSNLISQLEEYLSITKTNNRENESFYENNDSLTETEAYSLAENHVETADSDCCNENYDYFASESVDVHKQNLNLPYKSYWNGSAIEENAYSYVAFTASTGDELIADPSTSNAANLDKNNYHFEFGYETPPKDTNGEQKFHIEAVKQHEANLIENVVLTPENELNLPDVIQLPSSDLRTPHVRNNEVLDARKGNKTLSNVKIYSIKRGTKTVDEVNQKNVNVEEQIGSGKEEAVVNGLKLTGISKKKRVVKNQKTIKFNGTVMVRKFHFDDNEDYVMAEKSLLPSTLNKCENEVSSSTKKPSKTLISPADSTASVSILKKRKQKRIRDLYLDMDIESAFAQLKRKRNKKPERRRKVYHVIKPKNIYFNGVKPGDPKIFNMQPIVDLPKYTPSELISRTTHKTGIKTINTNKTTTSSTSRDLLNGVERNQSNVMNLSLNTLPSSDFLSNDSNYYIKIPEPSLNGNEHLMETEIQQELLDPDILKEVHKSNYTDEEVNLIIESLKSGIETRLPLKKRRMALTEEFQFEEDISYPAKRMLSIAEVEVCKKNEQWRPRWRFT